ncbi:MAG: holo-[acyl-carrier protein] synthase, partial [Acidobacteriota bacterium]|nr:holo-[acyl-carrier protein] synthase [Acidobacteriota bacterium]
RGVAAPQHYAARFAAKEAALKALGTGWSGGLAWQDVEVAHTEAGAPTLVLHRRALELFNASGATRAHISISHTTEHAIAQVVLES